MVFAPVDQGAELRVRLVHHCRTAGWGPREVGELGADDGPCVQQIPGRCPEQVHAVQQTPELLLGQGLEQQV